MKQLELLALSKSIAADAKDIDPPEGVHVLNFTARVHVLGTVTKGEPYEQTPTYKIPLKATLALCFEKMGFQRERVSELLIEAMTAAIMAETNPSDELAERMKDIDRAMEKVEAALGKLPKVTHKGKVTTKLAYEILPD